MKIAFDHQVFTMQRFGGISRYFCELATQLIKLDQEVKIFAGGYQNYYLSNLSKDWVKGKSFSSYPPKSGTLFNLINHYLTRYQINSFDPDIIHETYYSFSNAAKGKTPRVVTVYDMIHELFPESFKKNDPLPNYKKNALKRANHIISISHSTKRDLINLLDIPAEKISVIHLASNPLPIHNRDLNVVNHTPYFLFVGARSGYKNFDFLVKGLANSNRLKNEFDVIAFGGGRFSNQENQLISDLGFKKNQIRQVSGPDDLLASLYQSASAFIYPSIYEGFGLPPLEAMSLNCPVVSSNSSSMPEVIGDAGEFFSPVDMEEMINAIELVAFSEERRKDLIAKGKLRLHNFSWAMTANQTLDVYSKLL
jgi:glycosyltransferase involved in cell wall biosynthesis